MRIEVIYVDSDVEFMVSVEMREGATVRDAIIESGVIAHCSNVSLEKNQVGIFGKLATLDTPVTSGDRVEMYRPLKMSPMEARRLRSRKKVSKS